MSAQPLDEFFAGHGGPWTEVEWLAMPESMGRVELLDGALVVSPFPAVRHQRMVRNLARALAASAPEELEILEGLNVRVSRDRIMIPDIVVLTPPGLDGLVFDPAPVVLVVEVTSPSNAWVDRLVKPEAYARAGIPHYLRVDLDRGPEDLTAVMYALAAGGQYTEAIQADAAGMLVLDQPFAATLDLPALTRATR